MSDEREEPLRGDRSGQAGAWKDFASSVLLIAAVGGILVAGFVLKADRGAEAGSAESGGAVAQPAAIVLGSTITPEPVPPEPAPPAELPSAVEPPKEITAAPPVAADDPLFEKLAVRAAGDVARLEAAKGPWTAQLLVACRVATVDRIVAAAHGAPKLYVLPAEVRGEACFRVCWGSYASAKDAGAAADLPKALRGKEKVAAVQIAKVIR